MTTNEVEKNEQRELAKNNPREGALEKLEEPGVGNLEAELVIRARARPW